MSTTTFMSHKHYGKNLSRQARGDVAKVNEYKICEGRLYMNIKGETRFLAMMRVPFGSEMWYSIRGQSYPRTEDHPAGHLYDTPKAVGGEVIIAWLNPQNMKGEMQTCTAGTFIKWLGLPPRSKWPADKAVEYGRMAVSKNIALLGENEEFPYYALKMHGAGYKQTLSHAEMRMVKNNMAGLEPGDIIPEMTGGMPQSSAARESDLKPVSAGAKTPKPKPRNKPHAPKTTG